MPQRRHSKAVFLEQGSVKLNTIYSSPTLPTSVTNKPARNYPSISPRNSRFSSNVSPASRNSSGEENNQSPQGESIAFHEFHLEEHASHPPPHTHTHTNLVDQDQVTPPSTLISHYPNFHQLGTFIITYSPDVNFISQLCLVRIIIIQKRQSPLCDFLVKRNPSSVFCV
jgi:hypothetical protein